MKKYLLLIIASFSLNIVVAQVENPGQVSKDAATDEVNNNMENAADNGVNKVENGIKGIFKRKKKKDKDSNQEEQTQTTSMQSSDNSGNSTSSTSTSANTPDIRSYQNYDFVPGDSIIFYDDFTEDQDGEFPSHWNLVSGQGVLNKVGNEPAFFLTDGNYVKVSPLMKNKSYLGKTFTIEFDYMVPNGSAYGMQCFLNYGTGDNDPAEIDYDTYGDIETSYFPKNFSADYPGHGSQDDFLKKWHHCAIIMKDNQLKCYIDQYRELVMPKVGISPTSVDFGGVGSQDAPLIFRNVRIANGGNMNTIGQKFTAAKIITHGITFDIDKANLKPESMGTINMIVNIMKSNPDVKFEIDGHTDNTGEASHNLTLSQQRADAVKAQLVSMGINASRLTTKGFGDTGPIDTNDTPEGRANNRRVEFVKM
jgi:OmpA-OmpF porin, OOP family